MMKHRQKGVALIELALMLPLLLLLTVITTEFGRSLYQYNVITKSMRDAVRYLSVDMTGTRIDEARNLVVYGNPAGTGSPLAPGLALTDVAVVQGTAGSNPVINTVTITVNGYTFRPLFNSVFGKAFGNITYSDISATMRAPT
jgi:Flp pilus assembly protein TadG